MALTDYPAGPVFDETKTHRLGIEIRTNSGGFLAENIPANNAPFDFVPTGGAPLFTRLFVDNDTCNACHDNLELHGEARFDVEYCVQCHNPSSIDGDTGNSVDMKVMVHKIHRGIGLANGYQIIGFGGTLHDYSSVVFPQDVRNCQTCHEESDPNTPQASNWRLVANRAACGTCHDDIDWANAGHPGSFSFNDDTQYLDCHGPNGTVTNAEGQLNWKPNAYVDLRAKAGTSRRDVDRYDTELALNLGQNPLMRKYDLAYRYREFAELSATASWPERPISVSGSIRFADDSYTRSRVGLLASDDLRVAADLTWSLSGMSSLYVLASIDKIDSEQAGSQLFQAPDWRATHADEFMTFGGGYRTQVLGEKMDLEVDYTYGKGQSRIDVAAASGRSSGFPDIESRLDSLKIRLRYHASERLEGNLDLRYERFTADDWALQGVETATVTNLLGLGADPYDYSVLVIGMGIRYFFRGGGGDDGSGSD